MPCQIVRRIVGALLEPSTFNFYRLECGHYVWGSTEGPPLPRYALCEACGHRHGRLFRARE